MKNFRLSNSNSGIENIPNWKDLFFLNASDVIEAVKNRNWTTFEIEWKTPVTNEYAKIIEVVNSKVVYVTDSFKIPTAFKKEFDIND